MRLREIVMPDVLPGDDSQEVACVYFPIAVILYLPMVEAIYRAKVTCDRDEAYALGVVPALFWPLTIAGRLLVRSRLWKKHRARMDGR